MMPAAGTLSFKHPLNFQTMCLSFLSLLSTHPLTRKGHFSIEATFSECVCPWFFLRHVLLWHLSHCILYSHSENSDNSRYENTNALWTEVISHLPFNSYCLTQCLTSVEFHRDVLGWWIITSSFAFSSHGHPPSVPSIFFLFVLKNFSKSKGGKKIQSNNLAITTTTTTPLAMMWNSA